ncbi:thiosulfate sulfurtransferase Tum1p [Trichomonascus vanleenenianus]|uniref:sulfurtransferase n=1 Tax=Trichomonascus vanleenenianus TaxID=2268995 RepID=UPI003EC9C6A0
MVDVNEYLKLKRPITPKEYVELLKEHPGTVTFDATFFRDPPSQSNGESGKQWYLERPRIPNARFFDMDEIKDKSSPYPRMVPTQKEFDAAMGELGITPDDLVVVYDALGNISAPRAAWIMRYFGHDRVLVLETFPDYVNGNFALETGEPKPYEKTVYKSKAPVDKDIYMDFDDMVRVASDPEEYKEYNIIDARPAMGWKNGHVPGSFCVPFGAVLDPVNGHILPKDKLEGVFEKFNPKKPTVLYCGSGLTACIVEAALYQLHPEQKLKIYDGSWGEWAKRASPDLITKD